MRNTGSYYFLSAFILTAYLALIPINSFADTDDSLVAYYPLDGDVLDYGGAANNGAMYNGAVPTTDREGNPDSAIALDGIDDYLQIPNFESLNISRNGFSVSYYVRIHPEQYSPDGIYAILDKFHGFNCDGYATGWTFQGATDSGIAFVYGDNSNYLGIAGPQLLDDQWHHIVGTVSDSTFYLYVDGQLYNSRALGNDPAANQSPLYIGKWACGNSRFFHGAIDDLKIYDRILSDDEIVILSNNGEPEEQVCPPPPEDTPPDPSTLRPGPTAAMTITGVEVDAETGEVKLKLDIDPSSPAWAELVNNPQIRITAELETQSVDGATGFGMVGDSTVPLTTDGSLHAYGEAFHEPEATEPSACEDKGHRHRKRHKAKHHADDWWEKRLEHYRQRSSGKQRKFHDKGPL